MRPTPVFAAAAGFAMIGACTVETKDDPAENQGSNAAAASAESIIPAPTNTTGAETLGNQLSQLNENESEAGNSAE